MFSAVDCGLSGVTLYPKLTKKPSELFLMSMYLVGKEIKESTKWTYV